MMAHTHAALWWRQCIPACLHLLATRILAASMWQGEQVGAGLGTNRATRKRLNGLESHAPYAASRAIARLSEFGIIYIGIEMTV